jgi:hypothetical protein
MRVTMSMTSSALKQSIFMELMMSTSLYKQQILRSKQNQYRLEKSRQIMHRLNFKSYIKNKNHFLDLDGHLFEEFKLLGLFSLPLIFAVFQLIITKKNSMIWDYDSLSRNYNKQTSKIIS